MDNGMKLIAGLGNPGENYYKNRHNLGFQFIDYIAKRLNYKRMDFITKKKKADFLTTSIENEVTLVKPLTFMNNSGEGVLFMAAFMKISESDILVIYDDIDLEFGEIRLKNSDKEFDLNHNGIRSVRKLLKKENFSRLRIGIGRPKDSNGNLIYDSEKIVDYVLADFTLVEEFLLENIVFKYAYEIVKGFIKGGYEKAYEELVRIKPKVKDELSREPSLPEFD